MSILQTAIQIYEKYFLNKQEYFKSNSSPSGHQSKPIVRPNDRQQQNDNIAPRAVIFFLRMVDGDTVRQEERSIFWDHYKKDISQMNHPVSHDKAGVIKISNPKINTNDSQSILLCPAECQNFKSFGLSLVLLGLNTQPKQRNYVNNTQLYLYTWNFWSIKEDYIVKFRISFRGRMSPI